MKEYDVPQLSPQWWELHRGRPTASRFDKIITPKTGKLSAQHEDLVCELVAETHYPGPLEDLIAPPSKAMQHGIDCEPEARAFYELTRNVEVRQVGFITTDDGRFGASPDGLIREEGGQELKCPSPKVHVRYLLDNVLPAEYKPQVHGCLIVSERAWWDFMSYCPGFPAFIVRVFPDSYTAQLRAALEEFDTKYRDALGLFARKEAA